MNTLQQYVDKYKCTPNTVSTGAPSLIRHPLIRQIR